MILTQAQNLASKIVASMREYCDRVEIAGSIRRRKPECGDIEIVAIPKQGEPTDLFQTQRENLLYRWAQQVEAENRIWWIKPGIEVTRADQVVRWPLDQHGKYWRGWLVKAEIKLDLFLTTPETWGATYLIRTGPAEYSQRIVTECRPNHYFGEGKFFDRNGQFVPTPEEQSVYDALSLPFVKPEERR